MDQRTRMNVISRRASLESLLGLVPRPTPLPRIPTMRDVIRDKYFPNLAVVTHHGREVKFYDDLIKDKIVLLNFIYAECTGICPTVTANLRKVQRELGDRAGRDVFMYSLTLQPVRDTPPVLREYAAMHDVGPGWEFITGSPDVLERLRRSLGFVDPDPVRDRDKANHLGNLRYGNEPRLIWGACNPLGELASIMRAIRTVDSGRSQRDGGRS
jgi:protein SCO1/2